MFRSRRTTSPHPYANHLKEKLVKHLRSILKDESGQGLAEYGLILGLVAILCIAAVLFLSGQLKGILSNVGSSI